MRIVGLLQLCTFVLLAGCGGWPTLPNTPQATAEAMPDFAVIAHRGASGYLPEHTLEAAAMAHAMGADYIEQDVVMTRDDQLIVIHDLYLDAVTDVADRFPGRRRTDGKHYAIDFTLDEIRSLRVHERVKPGGKAEFAGRFPPEKRIFRIPTLADEIELILGLNHATGRDAGFYIEPKSPAWHAREGKDLMAAVLELLDRYGLSGAADKVLLQSFDQQELIRARKTLGAELRMVQLIGENSWNESPTDFDSLRTKQGLAQIAEYAQGIGPWIPQVVDFTVNGLPDISDLTQRAHAANLFVHAYTLRADRLPAGAGTLADTLQVLVSEARLDGVFTDHPDQVRRALSARLP
jgi:glycerophosphoryl diester phosphodiesterase